MESMEGTSTPHYVADPEINNESNTGSYSEYQTGLMKENRKGRIGNYDKTYSNSLENVNSVSDIVVEEKKELARHNTEVWTRPHSDSALFENSPVTDVFQPINLDQDLSKIDQDVLAKTFLAHLGIDSKPLKTKLSDAIVSSIGHYPSNTSHIIQSLIIARKQIDILIGAKYQEKKESKIKLPWFNAKDLEKKLKQNWIEQAYCRELSLLITNDGTRDLVAAYSSCTEFGDMFPITGHIFEKVSSPKKILSQIVFFTKKEVETISTQTENSKKVLFRANNLSVTLGIKYAYKFLINDLKKIREIFDLHYKQFKKNGVNFMNLHNVYEGKSKLPPAIKTDDQFYFILRSFLDAFYSFTPSREFQILLTIRKDAFKTEEEIVTFVGKILIFEIASAYLRSIYTKESPEQAFILKALKIITIFSINGVHSDSNHHDVAFISEEFYKEYRIKHVNFIKRSVGL